MVGINNLETVSEDSPFVEIVGLVSITQIGVGGWDMGGSAIAGAGGCQEYQLH